VKTVGPHPISWPDKGMRNQQSVCEPTIAELSGGKLWMLLRTATDNLYEAFSEDGGETWTQPSPSQFYSYMTMPTFHRLADGRFLLFWSNTAVFPDDHRELTDEDFRHTKKGRFTHGFHVPVRGDDEIALLIKSSAALSFNHNVVDAVAQTGKNLNTLGVLGDCPKEGWKSKRCSRCQKSVLKAVRVIRSLA